MNTTQSLWSSKKSGIMCIGGTTVYLCIIILTGFFIHIPLSAPAICDAQLNITFDDTSTAPPLNNAHVVLFTSSNNPPQRCAVAPDFATSHQLAEAPTHLSQATAPLHCTVLFTDTQNMWQYFLHTN